VTFFVIIRYFFLIPFQEISPRRRKLHFRLWSKWLWARVANVKIGLVGKITLF